MNQNENNREELLSKIKEVLGSDEHKRINNLEFEELAQEVSVYHRELQYQNDELRRVQEELQTFNARFSALFNNAPVGYVLCDNNFLIQNANKTFQELAENRNNLKGRKFTDFVHPDFQDDIYFFFNNLKKKEPHLSIEVSIVSANPANSTVPVNIDGNSYVEKNNRFFRLAISDLTLQKQNEKALKQKTHDLVERVKELNCLFGLSTLLEKPGIGIKEIFESLVNLIPPSWHYPKETCARIIFDDIQYHTLNFKETIWKQSAALKVDDIERGVIEVCYLSKMPELDEGPFMKEERELLDALSKRLGYYIERKETEIKFKENEQRLQVAANDLEGMLYVLDKDLRFTLSKGKKLSALGFQPDELVGKSLFDFYKTKNSNHPKIKQHREALKGASIKLESKHNDIIFSCTVSPLKNIDGEIVGILGLATDITERVKAEEALRASEETYHNLFHNAQVGLFRSGIEDGKILECNDQLAKMFGYESREELINRFVASEYYVPQSRRDEMVKEIKKKGEIINFKTAFKRKDGTEFIALYSARLFPQNGWLEGVLEDITEQEQSKELLKESEHLYRSVIENSNDGIYLMFNRRFELVNSKFQEIFGYTFHEIQENEIDPSQLIAPESMGFIEERIRKLNNQEDVSRRYEFTGITKSGEKKELEVSVSYVPYKGGTATQGILRDVTARKRFENELIQAKLKAEESDLLKSAFLANMSHEVRTPMNGILGFTNLLKEPRLSGEEQNQYVDIIQQSGQRMLNTIDDIISISKLESGTMKVKWEPYDINSHLDYFYNFFKPEANKKGLDLKLKLPESKVESVIQADKEKLNAVLSNLIKNAIKYTNSGTIEISYKIKPDVAEFVVTDTGIGIDEKRQKAVFERFIQEDFSTTKPYEGVGLGLAISKGYVDMMGGKIWMESLKGKGSKFYFTVPVKN